MPRAGVDSGSVGAFALLPLLLIEICEVFALAHGYPVGHLRPRACLLLDI